MLLHKRISGKRNTQTYTIHCTMTLIGFIKSLCFIAGVPIILVYFEKLIRHKIEKNGVPKYGSRLIHLIWIFAISIATPTPKYYNSMSAGLISKYAPDGDPATGFTIFYQVPNLLNSLNQLLFGIGFSAEMNVHLWKFAFSGLSYCAFYKLGSSNLYWRPSRIAFALLFTISTTHAQLLSDTFPMLHVWNSYSAYGLVGFLLVVLGVAYFAAGKTYQLSVVTLLCATISPVNSIPLLMFLCILLAYNYNQRNLTKFYSALSTILLSSVVILIFSVYTSRLIPKNSSTGDEYLSYITYWDYHRSDENYKISFWNLVLIAILVSIFLVLTAKSRYLPRWQSIGFSLALILAPVGYFVELFFTDSTLAVELKRVIFLRLSLIGIPVLILLALVFCPKSSSIYPRKFISFRSLPFILLILILSLIANPKLISWQAQSQSSIATNNEIVPGTRTLTFPGFSDTAIWDLELLPILNTENGIDFIPYIKNSEVFVNQILELGYGVTLSQPPFNPHCGCLPPFDVIRQTWEERKVSEWRSLSRRLDFDLVLAPKGMSVHLTPVLQTAKFVIYKI